MLINTFDSFEVIIEAIKGEDLLTRLSVSKVWPEIILIDVYLPVMDGFTTAINISQKYPLIKMVAISSKDDDLSIVNMINANCCAYLMKDIHPAEVERALLEIMRNGYYHADKYNRFYCRRFKEFARGNF